MSDHRRQRSGIIYLIHFETKLHHAQHYLGFAVDLNFRLNQHHAGNGSKLMAAVHNAAIGWIVARTWRGSRDFERRLKNLHAGPRLCPICRANLGIHAKSDSRQLAF
ncbi:MAG TPA: hypothetical protein VI729_05225 [Anaerolineales bacterium]|nr:hypothetical protein [Anaerolineales bacterium]